VSLPRCPLSTVASAIAGDAVAILAADHVLDVNVAAVGEVLAVPAADNALFPAEQPGGRALPMCARSQAPKAACKFFG